MRLIALAACAAFLLFGCWTARAADQCVNEQALTLIMKAQNPLDIVTLERVAGDQAQLFIQRVSRHPERLAGDDVALIFESQKYPQVRYVVLMKHGCMDARQFFPTGFVEQALGPAA